MNKILCLVALFIGVIASYGQATLKGKVTNSKGKPLASVNILIKGTTKGSTSGNDGVFVIKNVSEGKYKLKVSMLGYSKKEITFVITNSEDKSLPTIKLKATNNQLSEVTVKVKQDKTKVLSSSLRLKTELIKVPQNIQVISDNVLESQMITSILDKPFRNVSGVTIKEDTGEALNISMRGFEIGTFRNGMNVSAYGSPMVEDMAFVDRIEVIKGPSAFMLSAGEPGGLYNVVTKKPTTEKIGKVSLLAGTQDHYRGALDFGGKIANDERYLFRVNTMYESRGTHLEHQKPETRFGIAPSLLAKITPEIEFLTEFSYQKLKMIPGAANVYGDYTKGFASLPKNFSMVDERIHQSTIKELDILNRLTYTFNKNWSVEAKHMILYHNSEGPNLYGAEFDTNNEDVELDVSYSDNITEESLSQLYLNGKFNTGGLKHKILAGFDYSDKNYWLAYGDIYIPFNIKNPVYLDGPEIDYTRTYSNLKEESDYIEGSKIMSLYIQDELSFLKDKIRLTLAGRYTDITIEEIYPDGADKFSNNKLITPRVGLSVDILPKLTAYALFDQSFMPPSTYAEYRKPGVAYDPILGTIYEGGVKSKLLNGKFRPSVSAYKISKTNYPLDSDEEIIDPDTGSGSGNFYEIPDAKVTSKGIEIDILGKVTDELSIILNYAITDMKDSKGNKVAGYATHINNAWLTYDFNKESVFKGFGLSLGYEYQIERSTWEVDENGDSGLPNYFRLDGALSWENDKFRIGLNVNNLLDEYLYSGSQNGETIDWQTEPGINGRISLTYNLF